MFIKRNKMRVNSKNLKKLREYLKRVNAKPNNNKGSKPNRDKRTTK